MPKSWKSVAETTVSRYDWRVQYSSLEEAVAENYWRIGEAIAWYESGKAVRFYDQKTMSMGDYLPTSDTRFYNGWSGERLVFRDENGLVIPLWKIVEVYRALVAPVPYSSWLCRHPYTFRFDPVPRTGASMKRRWHGRAGKAYFTYQERREAEALELDDDAIDLGVRIRGKRSAANLPDAYDDLPSGRRTKNWKSFRRNRWKSLPDARV